MENLIEQLKEILEVDELDLNKKFTDYEEWDSLCSLSIIAILDSEYHKSMTTKEILSFNSINDFCNKVLS